MPYPNIFASLAGDQPASKLDENFNAAQLLTGKNAASGYVGLDASSNASIAGNLSVAGTAAITGVASFAAAPVFAADIHRNGAAATNRLIEWDTANLARWSAGASANAESGGNAGSDFGINRYDDTGAFLGTALTITRSNGVGAFSSLPLGPRGTPLGYEQYRVVPQAANYVFTSNDAQSIFYYNGALGTLTYTINVNVFAAGDTIYVGTLFANALQIVAGAGFTLIWANGSSGSGTRTIPSTVNTVCRLVFLTTAFAYIDGGGLT